MGPMDEKEDTRENVPVTPQAGGPAETGQGPMPPCEQCGGTGSVPWRGAHLVTCEECGGSRVRLPSRPYSTKQMFATRIGNIRLELWGAGERDADVVLGRVEEALLSGNAELLHALALAVTPRTRRGAPRSHRNSVYETHLGYLRELRQAKVDDLVSAGRLVVALRSYFPECVACADEVLADPERLARLVDPDDEVFLRAVFRELLSDIRVDNLGNAKIKQRARDQRKKRANAPLPRGRPTPP